MGSGTSACLYLPPVNPTRRRAGTSLLSYCVETAVEWCASNYDRVIAEDTVFVRIVRSIILTEEMNWSQLECRGRWVLMLLECLHSDAPFRNNSIRSRFDTR